MKKPARNESGLLHVWGLWKLDAGRVVVSHRRQVDTLVQDPRVVDRGVAQHRRVEVGADDALRPAEAGDKTSRQQDRRSVMAIELHQSDGQVPGNGIDEEAGQRAGGVIAGPYLVAGD